MYRVIAKLENGKKLAGPSAAESASEAVAEAEKAAEAAKVEIVQISVKYVEGVGPGLRVVEPRKPKKGKSK